MPTITSFLVGLGFDYDAKGEKQIASGIDSLKSKALQLGSVVAGAFGIKALTTDFATANDTLGKTAQILGVSADQLTSFGRAAQLEGGSIEGFIGTLQNLTNLQAGLLAGDAGFIGAAAKFGIDTNEFQKSKTSIEGFLSLADQFQKLSTQQRIGAAQAFGLSAADIRLLSLGREEIERLVAAQSALRPTTDAMTKSAADFNNELQNMLNGVGQFADRVSDEMLPPITEVIKDINEWIKVNKELGNSFISGAADVFAENLWSIAGALGAIGAGTGLTALGGLAGLLGAGGVAGALGTGGRLLLGGGLVGAGALGAASLFNATPEGIEDTTGFRPPEFLFQPISSLFPDTFSSDLATGIGGGRGGQQSAPSGGSTNVNVKLELDGQVIDKRIIKVNEQSYQQALDDLTSSTGG